MDPSALDNANYTALPPISENQMSPRASNDTNTTNQKKGDKTTGLKSKVVNHWTSKLLRKTSNLRKKSLSDFKNRNDDAPSNVRNSGPLPAVSDHSQTRLLKKDSKCNLTSGYSYDLGQKALDTWKKYLSDDGKESSHSVLLNENLKNKVTFRLDSPSAGDATKTEDIAAVTEIKKPR